MHIKMFWSLWFRWECARHMHMHMYVGVYLSLSAYKLVRGSLALSLLYSHSTSSYALLGRSLMNLILSEAHRHKHKTQIKGASFVCWVHDKLFDSIYLHCPVCCLQKFTASCYLLEFLVIFTLSLYLSLDSFTQATASEFYGEAGLRPQLPSSCSPP